MNRQIKTSIAIAVVALSAVCHQHLAVLILGTAHAVTNGGMTSAERARHIERLMRWGEPGKRAARKYALHFWGPVPLRDGYGINVLMHTEPAFLGLSETDTISMLGEPTDSMMTSNGTRELVYSTVLRDVSGDGKHQVHLIFTVRDHKVVGMKASQQFWRVNKNGKWVEEE